MSLSPYTAVLVASYGGPDQPDDVLPFMRNATAGKGIPDERLVEVSQHYMLFGGKSPINELNAQLMDALRAELGRRGVDVPVVIGNRNWKPYFADTASQLVADGHTRVLALATSAYQSYSSCRQYQEDLAGMAEGRELVVDKLDPFWDDPAFAEANARRVVDGVRALREQLPEGRVKVLFVTHSIPNAMNERSATGEPEARYDAQHLVVAERVAALAADALGAPIEWELTYCSRSGPPHVPWLEPDVNDRLEELADEVDGVVAAPIGFISDHMEVAYDLDTEAAQTAKDLGIAYVRAGTVGVDEGFVAALVDRMLDAAEAAREGRPCARRCQFQGSQCCLPPARPQRPAGGSR